MSPYETTQISFRYVENAFWNLDFGDNIHGIYGATPGETLHVFESGLVVYLTSFFLKNLDNQL